MPRVRVLSGLVIALALGGAPGCRAHPAPSEIADAGEPPPDPLPSARRPARRFYLGRDGSRCEVYVTEGQDRITLLTTACPRDLRSGERIRLAGDVCLREGAPDRAVPVVCPGALTGAEFEARTAASAKAR